LTSYTTTVLAARCARKSRSVFGSTRHEEIWAAYFHTIDKTKSPSRILFDPSSGRVDGSANRFIAPSVAGNGEVWIVVHDNRDGAAWTSFPVYVQ